MNNEAILRQRIKHVIEHGELYPTEKPLDKPLAVKLTLIVIVLQLFDTASNIYLMLTR